MTLDRAIVYYDELTKAYCEEADLERDDYMDMRDNAYECEQLAEWLKELKSYREHNSIPASSENRVKLEHIECEDAVSRTDVFNAIRGEERGGYVDVTVEYMLKVMSNLPSVMPKRKQEGE